MNILETLKKKAPTIMVGFGIAGAIGSGVWACKKTIKWNEVVRERTKAELAELEFKLKDTVNPEDSSYDEKQYKKDKRAVYGRAAWDTAKIFAGPVTAAITSFTSICCGHKILNNKYVATAALCSSLEASIDGYRSRVAEAIGVDKEYELYHNIETEEEEVEGKNGKPKKVKKKVIKDTSFYDIEFSTFTSDIATGDMEYDKMQIIAIQNEFDIRLKNAKPRKVSLGDLDKALGMRVDDRRWNIGKLVGWKYDPEDPTRDCTIALDLREGKNSQTGDPCWIISFNVDGIIVDL